MHLKKWDWRFASMEGMGVSVGVAIAAEYRGMYVGDGGEALFVEVA